MLEIDNNFKSNMQFTGKKLNVVLEFNNTTLDGDFVKNTEYSVNGELFTSVMRQISLEIEKYSNSSDLLTVKDVNEMLVGRLTNTKLRMFDTNTNYRDDIRLATTINVKLGVRKLDTDEFSYVNYGEFVLYDKEEIIEKDSIKLYLFDHLIDTHISYNDNPLSLDYSSNNVTVLMLLQAICNKFGFTLKTTNFTNANKIITEDKYIGTKATYRDILDEISAVAGGFIKIFNKDLYVAYPTETGEIIDESDLEKLTLGKRVGPFNSLVLARTPQEDNVIYPASMSDDRVSIRIENNQIMDKNREDFIVDLYNKINGLNYYVFESTSFGFGYFEFGDIITIKDLDGIEYKTILTNIIVNTDTGIKEKQYTEETIYAETKYENASSIEKRLINAELQVDKQDKRIRAVVEESNDRFNSIEMDIEGTKATVQDIEETIENDIPTTTQMNSAITQKANEITQSVSQTYATKNEVGEFVTETEMNTAIATTAQGLDVKISRKIGSSEVVTSLNASSDKVNLSTGRLEVNSNNNGIYDYNNFDLRIVQAIIMGWITVSSAISDILDANESGSITASDFTTIRNIINGSTTNTKNVSGTFKIDTQKPKNCISITKDGTTIVSIGVGGVNTELLTAENIVCGYLPSNQSSFKGVMIDGRNSAIKIISGSNEKIEIDTSGIDMHSNTISNAKLSSPTITSPSISNGSMSGTSISDSSITNPTLKGSVTISSGSALDCNRDIDMNGKDISDCTLRGGYRPIVNYSKSATVDSFNFANGSSTYLELITLYSGTYGITLWSSDARLKENIEDTEINALDVINKIKHRKFKWKDKDVHEELGYIAQEIEQVKENFVLKVPQRDKEGNIVDETYQINETKIIPYLSKAIQELSEENTKLKSIIDKQQSMIDFLYKKLNLNYEEG